MNFSDNSDKINKVSKNIQKITKVTLFCQRNEVIASMDVGNKQAFVSQFRNIIELLNPCMDDFLYVYDLQEDYYCISPDATIRFSMEKCQFSDVIETHRKFVYPADYELLTEDLREILQGKKNFHNMQYRWMDGNGTAVWINCRGQVTLDEEGRPEFLVGCINEIGKNQKADNTSGLLREASLQQEISLRDETSMQGFFMRIGIDNFKEINENRGMDYGDMILRRTAECIQKVIEPTQKLYRIVADEYAIVDFSGSSLEDAGGLYQKIREEIDSFIEENGYEVFYTVSAGILKLEDMETREYGDFVKKAEFALNEAKSRGKNQYYIYEEKDYEIFLRKRMLLRIMRQSITRNFQGFEAYFQPIMDIRNNNLADAETLLRFSSEETGMVSPAEFIPLLEESGLIIPVGRWVLHRAMEACSRIQKVIPDFRVSVNVSYIQILKSDIIGDIREGLEKYQLSPGSIVVELTESGYIDTDDYLQRFFDGLKENGILLALDDFGTGYSNFQYLYNISPDTIKIDRSFTIKALGNPAEYNLLQYMVKMAHSIHLKLCIEGIETAEELKKICEMEPDYIQGYFFGRPVPYETFVSEHIHKKS